MYEKTRMNRFILVASPLVRSSAGALPRKRRILAGGTHGADKDGALDPNGAPTPSSYAQLLRHTPVVSNSIIQQRKSPCVMQRLVLSDAPDRIKPGTGRKLF